MSVDTRIEDEPGPFEDAARWLRGTVAAGLAEGADRLHRARRIGMDGWSGGAAEAFAATMGRAVGCVDALGSATLADAAALEDFAGVVRHVRRSMAGVRAGAAAAGLPVAGLVIHEPSAADAAALGGAYVAAAEDAARLRGQYEDACARLRARHDDDRDQRAAVAQLRALSARIGAASGGGAGGGAGAAGIGGGSFGASGLGLAVFGPGDLGNTDGVPLRVRGEANWAALVEAIAAARARGDAQRLSLLEAIRDEITDPVTGQPVALLVQFDPDGSRYAVLWGDPDAAHVGVYVPGVGNPDEVPRSIRSARNLRDQAQLTGDGDAAVIMWNGYDNPDAPWDPDVLTSVSDSRARAGAGELTRFVEDGLLLGPGQDLTLIGHSYGSVVIGHGMAELGLSDSVDRVVVMGSPGMDVEDVADLHISGDRFYAERAPGDMIGNSAAHGADPASPGFGGQRLTTNAPDAPEVTGHSDYFTPNTRALDNIADVITDSVNATDIQAPTPGDHAGGWVTDLLQDGEDLTLTGWIADHYDGPGSQLAQDADHLLNGVAGYAGTGTRNLVDTLAGQVDVADILDLGPGR